MNVLRVNPNMSKKDRAELVNICPFNAIEETPDGRIIINAACKMCKICVKKGPSGAIELVEVTNKRINKEAWRGIAVYVEHNCKKIHPVTYELIGKAKELAKKINHPVYALFIGHKISDQAKGLLEYGVDEVFVYDYKELDSFKIDLYANTFESFINDVKPSVVLVGATNLGRSLAPRMAARFRTGLTADCTLLDIKENTDLIQIRPAFGGNIMAQIVTPNHRPQFCTVRYKVFNASEKVTNCTGKITCMTKPINIGKSAVEILQIAKKVQSEDITDANVIVAVGRGIRSNKDLYLAKDLAALLNGKVACTRPLVENGWFDPRMQIGLSGRTVKPKLIITLGISGSIQFVSGMQHSEVIIAINNDPHAPIFKNAHYGFVDDLYNLVPTLIDKIKLQNNSLYM